MLSPKGVDTERCASKDIEPQRGRHRAVANEDAGLQRGGLCDPHRLERGTKHYGNLSLTHAF